MTRRDCRILAFALIAGIILSIIIASYNAVMASRHHAFSETTRRMSRLSSNISLVSLYLGHLPGPRLEDAIQKVKSNKDVLNSYPEPNVLYTEDYWGNKLHYSINSDGKKAVIISNGPDGIFDHGHNDDLSQEIINLGAK